MSKETPLIEKWIPKLMLGFLLLLPFILVLPATNKTVLPQWAAASTFAATLLLSWLLLSHLRIHKNGFATLVAIITAAVALLSVWHTGTPDTHNGLIRHLTLAIFFLLGATYLSDTRGRQQLLNISVLAGSLVSLIGLIQYLSGTGLGLPLVTPNASVFINKNYAGALMDLVLPASLILLIYSTGKRNTMLATAGFTLCLSYTWILGSRGAWIGVIISMAVFLFLTAKNPRLRADIRDQRTKQRWIIAGMLLSAVIALTPAMIQSITTDDVTGKAAASKSMDNSGSVVSRLQMYQNTLQLIADNPIMGVGPNAFYTGFREYYGAPTVIEETSEATGIDHPHSDYLEYMAELGIPVAILVFTLFFMLWYGLIKVVNTTEQITHSWQAMAFLVGITAIFVHGAIDFSLHLPVSGIFLWTWMGAASGFFREPDGETQATSAKPLIRTLLVAIGSVYLVWVIANAYLGIKGNIVINEATESAVKNQCTEAIPAADYAMDLSANDLIIWQRYLTVYSLCMDQPEHLLTAANRVLDRDPNHTTGLLMRGNVLFQQGDYDTAAKDYAKLGIILPHRPSGYMGLGNVAIARGKYNDARVLYTKAKQLIDKIGPSWRHNPAMRPLIQFTSIGAKQLESE